MSHKIGEAQKYLHSWLCEKSVSHIEQTCTADLFFTNHWILFVSLVVDGTVSDWTLPTHSKSRRISVPSIKTSAVICFKWSFYRSVHQLKAPDVSTAAAHGF